MSEKKVITNISPSKLKHMRMLIESNGELTDGQKEMFFRLIEKQMPDTSSDFVKFHEWIKKGDAMLTSMLQEMQALRQLTSEDGDLISRNAVLLLLDTYRIAEPANDAENSINWVLGKLRVHIEALYAKGGRS